MLGCAALDYTVPRRAAIPDRSTLRSSTQCYAMFCYAPLCDTIHCVAMFRAAILHYATPRHAMTHYALPCSPTPCCAAFYDASRTLSGSLPCSTSG
eukprot:1616921-Pyramimonas_sp.AAC.1